MPEPPLLSTDVAIAVFECFGWQMARRESSHISLKKSGERFVLTIPSRREVPRGTLRQLLRKAGISVEDFTAAWRQL